MWNIAGVDIGAQCGISLMLIDIRAECGISLMLIDIRAECGISLMFTSGLSSN